MAVDLISRHEFDSTLAWLKDIDAQLAEHTKQEVKMEQRLDQLEQDVKDIKIIVTELRDIWTQGKGALRFLSILVGILAAGWGALVWAKEHLRF